MGRFIPEGTQAARVLDAVHDMFYDLVNKPTVDRYNKLDDAAVTDDLRVANELLGTLERLYDLKIVRLNGGPCTHAGVQTEEMLKDYIQAKHWQKMLDAVYGSKGETT